MFIFWISILYFYHYKYFLINTNFFLLFNNKGIMPKGLPRGSPKGYSTLGSKRTKKNHMKKIIPQSVRKLGTEVYKSFRQKLQEHQQKTQIKKRSTKIIGPLLFHLR
jgi:hypothetical protein